jgi:phosphomannomutase/phosphoglucomutase
MNEGAHHDLMHELVANADFPDGAVSHIDGIRVDFEDGFGLARASNTTPTVIFRFEATTETKLNQIKSLFRDQLLSLQSDLTLPF